MKQATDALQGLRSIATERAPARAAPDRIRVGSIDGRYRNLVPLWKTMRLQPDGCALRLFNTDSLPNIYH